MHPEFYRALAREHHADLDREAARARLAASLPHERRLRRDSPTSHGPGITIRMRLRLELLGRIDRALLAIEARVARALLNASPAESAATDAI